MDESPESEDEELVPSKRVASASTRVLEDSSDDELPTARSKSSRVSDVEQGRKRLATANSVAPRKKRLQESVEEAHPGEAPKPKKTEKVVVLEDDGEREIDNEYPGSSEDAKFQKGDIVLFGGLLSGGTVMAVTYNHEQERWLYRVREENTAKRHTLNEKNMQSKDALSFGRGNLSPQLN